MGDDGGLDSAARFSSGEEGSAVNTRYTNVLYGRNMRDNNCGKEEFGNASPGDGITYRYRNDGDGDDLPGSSEYPVGSVAGLEWSGWGLVPDFAIRLARELGLGAEWLSRLMWFLLFVALLSPSSG